MLHKQRHKPQAIASIIYTILLLLVVAPANTRTIQMTIAIDNTQINSKATYTLSINRQIDPINF